MRCHTSKTYPIFFVESFHCHQHLWCLGIGPPSKFLSIPKRDVVPISAGISPSYPRVFSSFLSTWNPKTSIFEGLLGPQNKAQTPSSFGFQRPELPRSCRLLWVQCGRPAPRPSERRLCHRNIRVVGLYCTSLDDWGFLWSHYANSEYLANQFDET